MVLSIIFLEDKHKILLHLSIFYEYQQFFQYRICFSIQPPDYSDPWPRLAVPAVFLNNVVTENDLKVDNSIDIANTFNMFFTSWVENLRSENMSTFTNLSKLLNFVNNKISQNTQFECNFVQFWYYFNRWF